MVAGAGFKHELVALSDSGWEGAAKQLANQIERWVLENSDLFK